jgi:hypothetical protein
MHAKHRAIGHIIKMMAASAIVAGATATTSVALSATSNYALVKSTATVQSTTTPGATPLNWYDM